MTQPAGHDVVVIGASTGGVEALSELVAGLPRDLPAAVFVVLHIAPSTAASLADLLSGRGPLRAALALHGESIVPGRIYVAPPDNHLTLRPGSVNVTRGPRENGHRPAVDPLFRSAARSYGPRVIGVVLTGHLDCGTAGLLSIKARGGLAVVQDPADAVVPEMPSSALAHVSVDETVSVAQMPSVIRQLVARPPAAAPASLPGALAQLEGDAPGIAAELVCPACNGKLTETELNGFHHFACHAGHAFSLSGVEIAQAEQLERALWSAVRALEESSALAGRLMRSGPTSLRSRFAEKHDAQRAHADLIRSLLLNEGWSPTGSAPVSRGGATMPDNRWKGDAVAESPAGESEAAADRVAGREPEVHPRESPPPNAGRFQPKKSTPADDREIQAEKQEEAIERHADDRAAGTGTAPKNL